MPGVAFEKGIVSDYWWLKPRMDHVSLDTSHAFSSTPMVCEPFFCLSQLSAGFSLQHQLSSAIPSQLQLAV